MSFQPPPTAGNAPGGPPPGWAGGAPPPRRRRGVAAVLLGVGVLVVVIVLAVVGVVWAYTRGAIRDAAADLPTDLCSALATAVGAGGSSIDSVENTLEDRKYATCLLTPNDDPDGTRVIEVSVSRMAGTSFAFASSRANELVAAFCEGADLGTEDRSAVSGLGGTFACARTVVDPDSEVVRAAVAGQATGHDDTYVSVVLTASGDDTGRAVRNAGSVAREVVARL